MTATSKSGRAGGAPSAAAALAGEVALVTGAGRGIGRATALRLAAAGAAVAALARTREEVDDCVRQIRLGGGRGASQVVDLGDDGHLQEVVAAVESELGPVSILVNNAGWAPPRTPLGHMAPDDVRRMLDVNLRAPLLLTRMLLPGLQQRPTAWIINVCSAFSARPFAGEAVYAATKAGLLAFTYALARECAGTGVRVAALCPAHVDTALIPANRHIDRGAFLQPDEVASAALAFVLGDIADGEVELRIPALGARP